MPRKGERLLICPLCGKRGVRLAFARHGEDNYQCRYCEWYAFALSHDRVDIEGLAGLRAANPEQEL